MSANTPHAKYIRIGEKKRERESISNSETPNNNTLRLFLLMLLYYYYYCYYYSRARTLLNYETRVDFNHSTTLFKLAELLSDMASSVS